MPITPFHFGPGALIMAAAYPILIGQDE